MGVWGAIIQGVLGVDASIVEGQAAKRQADRNTQQANEAATDAINRGVLEAGGARMAGTAMAARQAVAYSASGVDETVGTAANVQLATRAAAELEALTAENNAAREAWGYKKHGMDFQTQAGIDASRRGREIVGTLLSTGGKVMAARANANKRNSGSDE
jgi:hypothetical protein